MLLLHSILWRAAVAAFALWTTLLGVTVTEALPNIAPICAVNQLGAAAVSGPHVNNATRTVKSGSLAAGGFAVFLDSVALNASTVRTIEAGKAIRMFVRSATLLPNSTTPDKSFRGLHILLAVNSGTVNVSSALVPVSPFVKSPNCTSTFISGISHAEPSLKTGMLANLQVNAAYTNITLDVNLVVSNNNVSGSTFYFTQYRLASIVKKGDVAPTAPSAPKAAAPTVASAPKAAAAPTAPIAGAAPQASAPQAASAPTAPVIGAPPLAAAPQVASAPTVTAPTTPSSSECGLFGLSIFCPLTRCGIIGRLLRLCNAN